MSERSSYRRAFSLLVLLAMVLSLALPVVAAYTPSSPEELARLLHDPYWWRKAASSEEYREWLFKLIVPVNSSHHDPVVEEMFWERAVPEGWADGYYARILWGRAVPERWANNYYYYMSFYRILRDGYLKYRLNANVTTPVSEDVFEYYLWVVFGELLPGMRYKGFYYHEVFDVLLEDESSKYMSLLGWIAFSEPYGHFYFEELQRRYPFKVVLDDMGELEEAGEPVEEGVVEEPLITPQEAVEPGRLVVELRGPDGPVSDALVSIYVEEYDTGGEATPGSYVSSAFTNASGMAVFTLIPGTYEVVLEYRAYGRVTFVEVKPGEARKLTVNLGKLTLSFTDVIGRRLGFLYFSVYEQVYGLDGEPMPGEDVFTGSADVNGTWTGYVVPGLYCVEPLIWGYWDQPVIFYDVLVLPNETTSRSLQVVGAALNISLVTATGSPARYVSYEVVYRYAQDYEVYSGWIGYEGWDYVILRPGEYTVVLSEGHTLRYNVTLTPGEVADVTITLGVIEVHVTGPDGAPLRSVRVGLYRAYGSPEAPWREPWCFYSTRTDSDGVALIDVVPGLYAVMPVAGWGSENYTRFVEAAVDRVVVVNVTLPVGYLKVNVTAADGPVAWKGFNVYEQEDTYTGDYVGWYRTDEDGLATVPLLPGLYVVKVSGIGYNDAFYDVNVTEGSAYELNVTLGVLDVNITTASGMPASGIPVLVAEQEYDAEGNPMLGDVLVSEYVWDGHTRFRLTPGTYAVVIPGTNFSIYWWVRVGYGLVHYELNVSEANYTSTSFYLGRLVVNVTAPEGAYGWVRGTLYTVKYVNGEPEKDVDFDTIYVDVPGSSYVDLTPGTYIVAFEDVGSLAEYVFTVYGNETTYVNLNLSLLEVGFSSPSGQPLIGYEVELYEQFNTGGSTVLEYLVSADLSANGTAVFPAIPGCNYTVALVYPSGDEEYFYNLTVGEGVIEYYNFTVETGRLIVDVDAHNASPASGVYVEVYEANTGSVHFYGETRLNGRVVVDLLPGNYTVELPYAGLHTYNYFNVVVEAGEATTLNLTLGVVRFNVDVPEGCPASNIMIVAAAYTEEMLWVIRCVYANANGTALIPLLPGNYTIIIPGVDVELWWWGNRYGHGYATNVTVTEGCLVDLNYTLAAIAVYLVGPDPLEDGYSFGLWTQEDSELDEYVAYGYTDYEYAFMVTNGTYAVVLDDWRTGYEAVEYNVTASPGEVSEVVFELGKLIVNVTTASGEPVYGVKVTVEWVDEWGWTNTYTGYTDSRGLALFDLTPGNYTVKVSGGEYEVAVGPMERTYLNVTYGIVDVYLKGPDGEPIPGASVYLAPRGSPEYYVAYAVTDSRGHAVFEVPPGNYSVVLAGSDYYYYRCYASPMYANEILFGYGGIMANVSLALGGRATVNVTLSKLTVKVLGAGGAPAEGVFLELYTEYDEWSGLVSSGWTGENGTITWYVVEGTYDVVFRGYYYGWYDYWYLYGVTMYDNVGYGSLVEDVAVPAQGKANVTGTVGELLVNVTGPDGGPMEDVEVEVYVQLDQWSEEVKEGYTDEEGLYHAYLTTGNYTVVVNGVEYAGVEVFNGSRTTLNVTLSRITVHVNIPLLPGEAEYPKHIRVDLFEQAEGPSLGDYVAYAYTNGTGYTEFTVPPGVYVVVLRGLNTTGQSGWYGYGKAVYDVNTTTSHQHVDLNMSRVLVSAIGPEGPVSGIAVSLWTLTPEGIVTYMYTREEPVSVILTEGDYGLKMPHNAPDVYAVTVELGEYELEYVNVTMGILNVTQLDYRGRPVPGYIDLYSADGRYISTVYVPSTGTKEYPLYPADYYVMTYYAYGARATYDFSIEALGYTYLTIRYGAILVEVTNLDGEPVSGVEVRVASDTAFSYVYTTNASGQVLISPLTVAEYNVTIPYYWWYEDYYLGCPETFEVSTEPLTLTTVSLVLGRLRVNLVDADGNPVAGVSVSLYTTEGRLVKTLQTDERGRVDFDVTGGTYKVSVPGMDMVTAVVEDGELTNVTLCTTPADLAVTEVSWEPSEPSDGDTVVIRANVTNLADAPAYTVFKVHFYVDGEEVGVRDVYGLMPGASVVVAAVYRAVAGTHNVTVVVDPEGAVYDSNRTNNVMQASMTVLKPDLTVVDVTVEGDLVDGGVVTVVANVTNLGPGAAHREFYVAFLLNGTLVGRAVVTSLEVGEYVVIIRNVVLRGGVNNVTVVTDYTHLISEADEANNALSTMAYVPPVDLAVTGVSVSNTTPADGQPIVVRANVTNLGPGRTLRDFKVALLIDGEVASRITIVGGMSVNETRQALFYIRARGGLHNVTVVADVEGVIGDPDMSNNNASTWFSSPQPDIAAIGISVIPEDIGGMELGLLNVTVANIGARTLNAVLVAAYANGTLLGRVPIMAGLEANETVSVLMNIRLQAGTYLVEAVADPEEWVGDANRTNNYMSRTITVLASDLAITSISIEAPEPIVDGDVVTIRANVTNLGPGRAGSEFYVAFFVDEEFIGQVLVKGLDVNETKEVQVSWVAEAGNHTIRAVADDKYEHLSHVYWHEHLVSDPDRTNNEATLNVSVKGPEIAVTAVWIEPEEPLYGEMFTVKANVTNLSVYNTTRRITVLVRVRTPMQIFQYLRSINGIRYGEVVTLELLDLIALCGNYTVKVVADYSNDILEENETNNIAALNLTLPCPDLEVVNASVEPYPGPLTAWDPVNITVTVRNTGRGVVNPVMVAIYLNTTDINLGRPLRRTYLLDGLGEGEEVNVTIPCFARPPGNLTLIAWADPVNTIREEDEADNRYYFKSPLVRAMEVMGRTFTMWAGVVEEGEFKLANIGTTTLNVTSMLIPAPWVSANLSLPVVLEPGELADVPFTVNTSMTGLGSFEFNVTFIDESGYNITRVISVSVLDPATAFNVTLSATRSLVGLGEPQLAYLEISVGSVSRANFTISLSGNASSFVASAPDRIIAVSGEVVRIPLVLEVPENASVPVGLYYLTANVTLENLGLTKTATCNFTVQRGPVILDLLPLNNTIIASTFMVVSWRTVSDTWGWVYVREIGGSFTEYYAGYGTYHSVMIGGLEENKTYEFYVVCNSTVGSTVSEHRFINVTKAVVFAFSNMTAVIRRDYSQVVGVTVVNLDTVPHEILASVESPYTDLIVGFVGSGSMDKVLTVEPGRIATLNLVIHAADTTRDTYNLTLRLLNLDNNAEDRAVLTVHVVEPVFNVSIELLGEDPHTLVRTYRLTNFGDTIADLSVTLDDNARAWCYVYPAMNHIRLESGESIVFYVVPVLQLMPEEPELRNVTLITSTGASRSTMIPLPAFTPLPGYVLFQILGAYISLLAQGADWYCTNKPYVEYEVTPAVDPPDNVTMEAYLEVTFIPGRFAPGGATFPGKVLPHDGNIYLNDHLVYSWQNEVPNGTIRIPVPATYVNLDPSGAPASNRIKVETLHMNRGHYVVCTDVKLLVSIRGKTYMYVYAESYDEALRAVRRHHSGPKPGIWDFGPEETGGDPEEEEPCEGKEVPLPPIVQQWISRSSLSFNIMNNKLASALEWLLGDSVEADASLSLSAEVTSTHVKIAVGGSFEISIVAFETNGKAKGSIEWGLERCEWRFKGGEVTGSLDVGYVYKPPRQPKIHIPEWVPKVGCNEYGVELKLGIYLSFNQVTIKIHEDGSKSIDAFLIGLKVKGTGSLEVGILKVEAGASAFGYLGVVSDRFTAEIGFKLVFDVEVKLWMWTYKFLIGWGKKAVYQYGVGWSVQDADPQTISNYSYYYYGDVLWPSYVMLADEYSSMAPSLARGESGELLLTWLAVSNESCELFYAFSRGANWTQPATIPLPEDTVVYMPRAVYAGDTPMIMFLAVPYEENATRLIASMGNSTLYYTVYVNGSWADPAPLAYNVSMTYAVARAGSHAIVAWSTGGGGVETIWFSVWDGVSWSPAAVAVASLDGPVLSMSMDASEDMLMLVWDTILFANETLTLLGSYYTVFNGTTWSEPELVPGSVPGYSPDVAYADGVFVVAWERPILTVAYAVFNGTTWVANGTIGDGLAPRLASGDGYVVAAFATIGDELYRDVAVSVMDVESLKWSGVQMVTSDRMVDEDVDVEAGFNGTPVVVWARRPWNETGLPENTTYASGLYYQYLSRVYVEEALVSGALIEGSPLTVNVTLANDGFEGVNATLAVYLDGELLRSVNVTLPAFSEANVALTITPVEVGTYNLTIALKDVRPPTLLPALSARTMVVEVGRLLEVEAPVNETFVEGVVAVNGTVRGVEQANVTISYASLASGEAEWVILARLEGVVGSWSTALNTTTLPDGPVLVKVNASTGTGACDELLLKAYVDNTPPTLSLVEPANESYVGAIVNVTVEAYDTYYALPEGAVQASLDEGATWVNMTWAGDDLYYMTLNTTEHADNTTIRVLARCRDLSGKTTTIRVVVVVDNTPPVTTDNSTDLWYNETVVIALKAYDNVSGVAATYYAVDSTEEWYEGDLVEIPAPPDHSNDGVHVVYYYSVDVAGNIEEVMNCTVRIDTEAPALDVTSIANESYVSGVIDVSGVTGDEASDVESVWIRIDRGAWIPVPISEAILQANRTWSYTLNTSELADGWHLIEVKAVDLAGNARIVSVSILVDNTPPVVEVTAPVNGSVVSGLVNVTFTVEDLTLVNATLYVDGAMVADVTNATWYLIDTAELANGWHEVKLVAYDALGHVSEDDVLLLVDNTPPVVEIVEPVNGSVVTGIVLVEFNASDETTWIAEMYYSVDYGPWIPVEGTSFDLDTTTLADGAHVVTVHVIDAAGHEGNDTVAIIVDNTAPSAEIAEPANGSVIGGLLLIAFNYSDLHLDEAWLSVGPYTFNVTGAYSYVFNTTLLPDGVYDVVLTVYDLAGNVNTSTVTIIIDNTPPEAVILSPANGSIVGGGVVTFEFNYSDVHLLSAMLLVGDYEFNVTGAYSLDFNTTLLPDGACLVMLVVADEAYNVNVTTICIAIDNTPPLVEITAPVNGSIVTGTVAVNFTAWDMSPFNATLYVDGVPIADVTSMTYYELNTTELADGWHTVAIEAVDVVGNANSSSISILVDNTPPSVSIVEPAEGQAFNESIPVTVTVLEANFDRLEVLLNGSLVLTSPTANTTVIVDVPADGYYVVTVVAYDLAGSSANASVGVYYDVTPPVVEILRPADGELVSGVITINFTVSDTLGYTTYLYVDGVLVGEIGEGVTPTLDTMELTDGSHTVMIRAVDEAGNAGSDMVTIVVDNTAPEAKITSPTSGTVLQGTVTIRFTYSDPHLSYAKLVVAGVEYDVTGLNEFTWDTTTVPNGVYEITLGVVDELGHETMYTVTVTVSNPTATLTPPTTPTTPTTPSPTPRPPIPVPLEYIAVIAAVAVVAVLVPWLIRRVRR